MNGHRADREDVRPQLEAVGARALDLSKALHVLQSAAKTAERVAFRGRMPDMGPVYAATEQARRCEEALDLAQLDLRTASGEDA